MDKFNNFVQVASNCSQFSSTSTSESMTSSTANPVNASCLSCVNYKNQHCQKNLYDKIQSNLTTYSE